MLSNLINLKDCIKEVNFVWTQRINLSTISNCFKESRICKTQNLAYGRHYNQRQQWERLENLAITGNISLDELITADETIPIAEFPTSKEITIHMIKENNKESRKNSDNVENIVSLVSMYV